LSLTAQAWHLAVDFASSPADLRRTLEEHVIGLAAMNRPVWLLIDQVDELTEDIARGCRWLSRLAMRHGLTPALVGVVIGVIGALGATQLATSLLYGVAPRDPPTFIGVVAAGILVVGYVFNAVL
jgi:hypothetical protein